MKLCIMLAIIYISSFKQIALIGHLIGLTEHQDCVVVKGEASDWLIVTSDVPHGSLLGSLFFMIYINDLPGVISKDSSIALYMYADYSKMFRVINTQEDLSSF